MDAATTWKRFAAAFRSAAATTSDRHEAIQGETYGIALWMPYYGSASPNLDSYWIRSAMCPQLAVGLDVRRADFDFALLRRLAGDFRKIGPYLLGDYYPLTPYSLDESVWMAWQFDCPEKGEGMVQAFRHGKSIYETARVRLRGLAPEAVYVLTNLDVSGSAEVSGRDLMDTGLPIVIKDRPGTSIIVYKKKKT